MRAQADEYESYDTPTSAATTFLLSLAANRTKMTFMPILGLINRVLSSYVSTLPIRQRTTAHTRRDLENRMRSNALARST